MIYKLGRQSRSLTPGRRHRGRCRSLPQTPNVDQPSLTLTPRCPPKPTHHARPRPSPRRLRLPHPRLGRAGQRTTRAARRRRKCASRPARKARSSSRRKCGRPRACLSPDRLLSLADLCSLLPLAELALGPDRAGRRQEGRRASREAPEVCASPAMCSPLAHSELPSIPDLATHTGQSRRGRRRCSKAEDAAQA